jgi:hypothetical protein
LKAELRCKLQEKLHRVTAPLGIIMHVVNRTASYIVDAKRLSLQLDLLVDCIKVS